MTASYVQCRYLRLPDDNPTTVRGITSGLAGEQCTAEVIDEDAPVLLCSKHGGRFMAYVNAKTAELRAAKQGATRLGQVSESADLDV